MWYTHGQRWTDDLIKEKLLEVVDGMKIDRMPSRRECETYFHNVALANAVSKRDGWRAWASKLGLPIKKSETYFGKTQEMAVAEILRTKGFEVVRMSQNFPYDILVNECVKIDVKASHLYRGKNGDFYTFNLEKPFATCDLYILCSLDDNDEIINIYIVPSKFVIANTQISIGAYKSKYDRFVDRWDYLSSISDYWSQVS